MRTLLFLNNWGGWRVAQWLRFHDEEIVGLVIHPEAHRRFGDEILRALKLPPRRVWLGDQLRDPKTLAQFRDLRPDIGISAFFAFILRPELFEIFPHGCINLHSGYLPFNRGWHTNVWPIIEGSSAGATVHYVDSGVDTGDVISQRRFPVDLTDTGGVLHEKITRGLIELFKDTWPRIKDGSATRTAQNHSKATHHRKGDLGVIDQIHLDRHYRAADLLNLLRARTYPPYPAAYAIEDGRRSYYHINYATRPQRNERATKFTLEQEFTGREFLTLLATSSEPLAYPAYFEQPFGRVHARIVPVDEASINIRANPPWTQDHFPPTQDDGRFRNGVGESEGLTRLRRSGDAKEPRGLSGS